MNNERRKRLAGITEQLEGLKNQLEEVLSEEEEEEAYENLPESFQDSERGETMQEKIYSNGVWVPCGEIITRLEQNLYCKLKANNEKLLITKTAKKWKQQF